MRRFEWEDETCYQRGERGNVPARVLTTRIEDVKIIIHRHKDYTNTWLLTCYDLKIEKENLNTNDFENAEEKVKEIILNRIYRICKIRDFILG